MWRADPRDAMAEAWHRDARRALRPTEDIRCARGAAASHRPVQSEPPAGRGEAPALEPVRVRARGARAPRYRATRVHATAAGLSLWNTMGGITSALGLEPTWPRRRKFEPKRCYHVARPRESAIIRRMQ